MDWPLVILILGILFFALSVWAAWVSFRHESRKLAVEAAHDEDVRRLVDRYEQLAATTLDVQTRAAADVAELRARATAIEQILRTVE